MKKKPQSGVDHRKKALNHTNRRLPMHRKQADKRAVLPLIKRRNSKPLLSPNKNGIITEKWSEHIKTPDIEIDRNYFYREISWKSLVTSFVSQIKRLLKWIMDLFQFIF